MKLEVNINNDHILKYFPNFEYFNCIEPERLDFSRTDNLAGSQQRAFLIYHILHEVKRTGEVGISLGSGQEIEPFVIGIDHYYGDSHPLYGGEYRPHLTSKCQKLPFNDNVFAFVVASHVFEHMNNPIETFKEWVRILKPDGALILVMPDAKHENVAQPWDFDHKIFYTPEIFEAIILEPCKGLIETEIIDTLKNSFSFNYVGRKR